MDQRHRSQIIDWFSIAVASNMLLACTTFPVPEGVKTDRLGVARTLIAEVPSGDGNAIFAVEPHASGEYDVIWSRGVLRAGGSAESKQVLLDFGRKLHPIAIANQPRVLLGVGADDRLYLQKDGRVAAVLAVPAAARFAIGNIAGDANEEMVIADHRAESLRVFDIASGTERASIPTPGYVTDLDVADVEPGGDAEILLFTYPHDHRQGRMTILDGRGTILRSWSMPVAGRPSVIEHQQGRMLLLLENDSIVMRDSAGQERQRFTAPDARYFRDVHGLRLANGTWVMTVSGSGYVPWSMVLAYDHSGSLQYREVTRGRIYSLVAGDASTAIIPIGTKVWRYSFGQGVLRESADAQQ